MNKSDRIDTAFNIALLYLFIIFLIFKIKINSDELDQLKAEIQSCVELAEFSLEKPETTDYHNVVRDLVDRINTKLHQGNNK